MMPIFFHIESHIWIAYLFFLNGLLLHWCFCRLSGAYSELTAPLEAQFLAAFFFSIAFNGFLLLILDVLGLQFALMEFILPMLSVGLLLLFFLKSSVVSIRKAISFEWGWWRLGLYVFVFVILFYNGGLIEQISDAWWHMSLANKIAMESSYFLETGHLNGIYSRYYPPLWHGNLALAKTVSGESLPVLWNSFTAWGGVIKVMGFYLMTFSLSKDKATAILGAILFVLLPGLGDAYLRVSAWPSHIAYGAWFFLFFVCFSILDKLPPTIDGWFDGVRALWSQKAGVLFAILLVSIIAYSHQVELVFFAFGILFYFIGISVFRVLNYRSLVQIETANWVVNIIGRSLFVGGLLASIWFIYQARSVLPELSIDLKIVYFLPVLLLVSLLISQKTTWRNSRWGVSLFIVSAGILIASVDLRHLFSLFDPERAYPRAVYHEMPVVAVGWFGSELKIPGWHLQLRFGLLYSGVVSLIIAPLLVFYRPSRSSIFLASTGLGAFLFCISPYLFHWLREILNYHSPWRIAILIFHPMVFAVAINECWQVLQAAGRVDAKA